jgi:hypothetical protein
MVLHVLFHLSPSWIAYTYSISFDSMIFWIMQNFGFKCITKEADLMYVSY